MLYTKRITILPTYDQQKHSKTHIPRFDLHVWSGPVVQKVGWSSWLRHRGQLLISHVLESCDLMGEAHGQTHPQAPSSSTGKDVHYWHVAVHCQHRILRLQEQLGNVGVSIGNKVASNFLRLIL